MKRRAFNMLAAISIVLLITMIALGIRSYWRYDHLLSVHDAPGERKWTRSFYQLDSARGAIVFACERETAMDQPNIEAYRNDPNVPHLQWSYGESGDDPWREQSHSDNPDLIHRCGLVIDAGTVHEGDWPPFWLVTIIVPHWLLVTAFAVFPAIWLVAYYRRQRDRHGHCPTCGYDLRATPERCPECGTPSVAD